MYIRRLHTIFYLGLALLVVATYINLQHWQYSSEVYTVAVAVISIFSVLILAEIVTSKKATIGTKVGWASLYILIAAVPIFVTGGIPAAILIYLTGTYYLNKGRRKFLVVKPRERQFDSIDM